MGWINIKCPHCNKSNDYCYGDFSEGYDKHQGTDIECEYCENEYDILVVSENIYVESLIKSEPRDPQPPKVESGKGE